MKVIDTIDDIDGLGEAPIATVGKFEGVHRGHMAILSEVCRRSKARSSCCVVLTFEPHPQVVLDSGRPLLLLNTRQEKLEILARFGICGVVLLPFTREMAELAPQEFIRRILVDRVRVRELVVGYNFVFGKDRAGDLALLEELGQRFGFVVDAVPPVIVDGTPVSSTRIRKTITAGRMREAETLLGRPYAFQGYVVQGDGRGRKIGFPTANLQVDSEKLLPPNGVYAVRARILGSTQDKEEPWDGLMNIGVRPSFGGKQRSVEVHLGGFSGSLYGKQVRVEILEHIRDEMDFAKSEDLVSQIKIDKSIGEEIWAKYGDDPE